MPHGYGVLQPWSDKRCVELDYSNCSSDVPARLRTTRKCLLVFGLETIFGHEYPSSEME